VLNFRLQSFHHKDQSVWPLFSPDIQIKVIDCTQDVITDDGGTKVLPHAHIDPIQTPNGDVAAWAWTTSGTVECIPDLFTLHLDDPTTYTPWAPATLHLAGTVLTMDVLTEATYDFVVKAESSVTGGFAYQVV
jgi:hypothetical protein